MIGSTWLFVLLAVLISIPVFMMGVFSLQPEGMSKQMVLSASPTLPVVTTPPQLTTDIYRVFEVTSGTIIVSSNEKKVVPMASVAKLFTGATIVSDYDLVATTTMTWADLASEGEAGKLSYGDEYSLQELLFPLLLESSNDAAATLNRATNATLINEMNTFSQALGAVDTVFSDPAGLSDDTVSTAHDLQLLLTEIYENKPHILDITLLPKYIGTKEGWINNNPFIEEDGYQGGKHGFTTKAQRTAVALFEEEINGKTVTLGYIILGSSNLKEDMATLRASVRDSATEN